MPGSEWTVEVEQPKKSKGGKGKNGPELRTDTEGWTYYDNKVTTTIVDSVDTSLGIAKLIYDFNDSGTIAEEEKMDGRDTPAEENGAEMQN